MVGVRKAGLLALVALSPLAVDAQEETAPRGTRAMPPDVPPGTAEGLQGNLRAPEEPPGTSSPGENEPAANAPKVAVPQPQPAPVPPPTQQQEQVAEEPLPEQGPAPVPATPQPQEAPAGTVAGGAPQEAPTGAVTGGARQATPQRPVGSPPPPSEEVQAMVAPEPELLARSKVAREQIRSAEMDIATGRYDEARIALEQANQILSDLYTNSRGAWIALELGESAWSLMLPSAAAVDLKPLAAQIDAVSALVPPEVVARVQVAARAQRNQRSEEAAAALLEARQLLMSDLGLTWVEEAYARSRAAAAELEAGHPTLAQSLLNRTTTVLAQWQVEAPLVPIRLNLRAAARAAEDRNWAQAEVWVNQAAEELRIVQADAPAAMARRLAPLAGQLSSIQERLAAGKQPGPRQFRLLAQSASAISAG